MKHLMTFFTMIFAMTAVMAQESGQCSALLASKTYSPSPDKNLISYQCTYECMTSDGHIEKVLAKHSFDRRTQNEMFDLVCEGVLIGKIVDNGMTTYAPIGVDSFWAILSSSQDLQTWAKNTKSLPTEKFVRDQKMELIGKIEAIKNSYSQVDALRFPQFSEASVLLSNELSCWEGSEMFMSCPLFQTAANLTPSDLKEEAGGLALALQQLQAHGKILFRLTSARMKL